MKRIKTKGNFIQVTKRFEKTFSIKQYINPLMHEFIEGMFNLFKIKK